MGGVLPLLAILPLSLAAGVDLYLTLLFLGLSGRLGWEAPPPGALGDLAVPVVLAAAAALFLLERWMEGSPLRHLAWNAAHTVVRPLAGALLASLALAELPPASRIAGATAAAALTLAAHLTRSGWGLLLLAGRTRPRLRLLVSVAEDVGTLALLSLVIDAPVAAVVVAAGALAAGLVLGSAPAGAFLFALHVLRSGARALLGERKWYGPERFPRWIRRALRDPALAPGGGLRGSPAAAAGLPGAGLFRAGWVVVRGGSPLFLYRQRGGTRAIDLGSAPAREVVRLPLLTAVDLGLRNGRTSTLYFGLDGPEPEDLRAEFLL